MKKDNLQNVLVIFGSPHTDGYTAELTNAFIGALPGKAHVDIISAFKSKIVPCIDCGMCKKQMGCAFGDFNDFDEKFKNADVLVFATPVYNLSVPAPLKSIIDRTQQYYNARFSLNIKAIKKHKKAVLLVTAGSKSTVGAHCIEQMLKQTFTVTNTELYSSIFLCGTDNCDEDELARAVFSARHDASLIFEQ